MSASSFPVYWLTVIGLLATLSIAEAECSAQLLEEVPWHTDAETGRRIRTTELVLHPWGAPRTLLFEGDHVLAVGHGQGCYGGTEHVLTLYRSDGSVRWSLNLEDLVPYRPRPEDHRGFYVSMRRDGTNIDAGASVWFVVNNYDELRVRLRDAQVIYRAVPVAELGDDTTRLKARAKYLREADDRRTEQTLLRKVLARNPRDYEVVAGLSAALGRDRLYLQAADLWRDLEAYLPLPALSRPAPNLVEVRYWQAYYLDAANSHAAALRLVSDLTSSAPQDRRLWELKAKLLLALGRVPAAQASYERLLDVIVASYLESSAYTTLPPTDYYDTVDFAAEGFEHAGHEALGQAFRQRPPRQSQIIQYLREQDLKSAERWHAEELARIHLGAATGRDYRTAIKWYEVAIGKHDFSAAAEAELALCHLYRHSGEAPDFARAVQYCDLAAERGNLAGRFWSGVLRLAGLGTQRDAAAAIRLIESADKPPGAIGFDLTAPLPRQRRGFGVAADLRWAATLLEPYAERGNAKIRQILEQIESSPASRLRE